MSPDCWQFCQSIDDRASISSKAQPGLSQKTGKGQYKQVTCIILVVQVCKGIVIPQDQSLCMLEDGQIHLQAWKELFSEEVLQHMGCRWVAQYHFCGSYQTRYVLQYIESYCVALGF